MINLKNKFNVRIKHFAEDKYCVQYCYYRIIPIWCNVLFWFEQTLTGGTECWSINLFNVYDAEIFSKKLNSIDDVNNYYEIEYAKRKYFYKRQKEYFERCVPYNTKKIK